MTTTTSSPKDVPPPPTDTILSQISHHTAKTPSKTALTFLTPSKTTTTATTPNTLQPTQSYTYQSLSTTTTQLAHHLLSNPLLSRGDTVILVYPPSLDFIIAFLACLKAGLIAVPVFPPMPGRRESVAKFSNVVEDCGAKVALTNKEYDYGKKMIGLKQTLTRHSITWPTLSWIITSPLPSPTTTTPPSLHPHPIAFLQYTSGSTSHPKGVIITHTSLLHNLSLISHALKASTSTVVVSWLPQYHDMGLIGSYLGILYHGGCGYYMSPMTFLQNPSGWVQAMSDYEATHVQSPHFGYKLTARKWTSSSFSKDINLKSVVHAINGAEPIDVEGMETFYDVFTKNGFERVIFPTYGLAEHTVFVSSNGNQVLTVDKVVLEMEGRVVVIVNEISPETTTTRRIVGCGSPSPAVDCIIVNEFSNVGEDTVGEIWLSSPSVAGGYWNNPQATTETFHATLSSGDDENKQQWLRTGDLGFLHKGELFICGRLKDLIIVGGRNYYPQDVEGTAERGLGGEVVRPGCSAVFQLDGDGDGGVVLLMELREVPKKADISSTLSPLLSQLQSLILHEHTLTITHILFLHPRTIPKTTSGKIARSWCKKAYLAKTLQVVHQSAVEHPKEDGNVTNNTQPKTIQPMEIEQQQQQQQHSKVDYRSASISVITSHLTTTIQILLNNDMSSSPPLPLDQPLTTILDSMNLAQLQSILSSQYQTIVNDEYLFMETSTISQLSEVVKLGSVPEDGNIVVGGGSAADMGKAKGLAGMLGCPPGIVCVIM